MSKAKCYRLIRLLWNFLFLVAPASAQELPRGAQPPSSAPHTQAVDAREEKAAEQKLWDSIKESSDPQAYKTFLTKYPRGQFEDEAQSRLSALLGQEYVALFMKRLNVNRHWSNVEQQLVRRANLIPGLIESLHATGVQEREVFGQLAGARARLLDTVNAAPQAEGDNKTPEQRLSVIEAANHFNRTLKWFDPLQDNYPQLRSNERFLSGLDELAGATNRAFVARADYNDAVMEYNTARRQPPMAVVAESHGFTEEPHYKSEHERPVAPKIRVVPPPPRPIP